VVVVPTSDRSRVASALASLAVDTGTGTVIGDGLSAALDAVQEDRGDEAERPAAVILLSDGRDSGSTIAPELAASRAAELGVLVYTVAIGESPSESPGSSASTGVPVSASTDIMGQVAETTGAHAYTTNTSDQLTQVYDTLGSRLSSELAIDDSAGPFVVAAVVMLLAATGVLLIGNRDSYA
jgi:Ca-activated chloride channel family protein